MFDAKLIRHEVDLRELVKRYTRLSNGNGPCPKCGGEDRFYIRANGWQFGCRGCHQKPGDAIEFLMWVEGVPFREACARLAAEVGVPATSDEEASRSQPVPNKEWIERATSKARSLAAIMASDAGQTGRDYLCLRGIEQETWKRFSVGFDPAAKAISLPYVLEDGEMVVAIKYRRVAEVPRGQRYYGERGGKQGIFGLQQLVGPTFGRALIIVEGELNALSIWQATKVEKIDVLSVGSDSGNYGSLTPICARYRSAALWLDDPDRAADALARIGRRLVRAFKSGTSPAKMDANQVLVRHGHRVLRQLCLKLVGLSSLLPTSLRPGLRPVLDRATYPAVGSPAYACLSVYDKRRACVASPVSGAGALQANLLELLQGEHVAETRGEDVLSDYLFEHEPRFARLQSAIEKAACSSMAEAPPLA